MPAISTAFLSFMNRDLNQTSSTSPNTTSSAAAGIDVVCAWPLSSQYGTGSRVLYYVLVAACVLARRAAWLRNACVGLALLLPVLAALHGIVLAAVHVDGAVDMDIYGAFQMCAVGVLTALVAVRRSRTYFNEPGRNTIFVWAGLILAGLLSLTVEFYRSNGVNCIDSSGIPVITSVREFPYGITCNLTCDPDIGPFSPIRGGSANNIYVIPAPKELTFDAATLICGACCIPAVLLLVSMWFKILEVNLKKETSTQQTAASREQIVKTTRQRLDARSGRQVMVAPSVRNLSPGKSLDLTPTEHNEDIPTIAEQVVVRTSTPAARFVLKWGEIIVFGAAVLAILILGERNLWSAQIKHEQEPLGNIGQWSPLAGTGLAILSSGYLLLADAMATETAITDGRLPPDDDNTLVRRSARGLIKFNKNFLKLAHSFDDKDFREGNATGYPEIPGEMLRNVHLSRTISNYSPSVHKDSTDLDTPVLERPLSHESVVSADVLPRKRRDTLEVPSMSPPRSSPIPQDSGRGGLASDAVEMGLESPGTPTIVISAEALPAASPRPESRRHTVDR